MSSDRLKINQRSYFNLPNCLLHAVHVVGKTIGLVEGLFLLREAVPHYFMQGKHIRKQ